jgi:hypothetical protein
MKLLSRKSKFERVLETLENQQMLKAAARHAVESAVAGATNPEQGRRAGEKFESFDLRKMAGPVKTGHGPLRIASDPIKKAGKPTLAVAAGVAGVTAASAAVSSLRKRESSGS